MYSKTSNYKTRTYSTITQDLSSLPLASLYQDCQDALELERAKQHTNFQRFLEEEKRNYVAIYNSRNEDSYEGSFEELDLEGKARAKLDKLPDPRVTIEPVLEKFAKTFNIPKNADWFFHQALAKFGQLPLEKVEGFYSPKRLFVDHIKSNRELMGLYYLFMHPKRGLILEKQTDPKFRDYSSLVPLIMSAFKRFNGIQYSQWSRDEVFGIVEPNLVSAMTLGSLPELTAEDVIAERELGLTIRTGKDAGTLRNPSTTYSLYFNKESPLSPLPTLARIMMCQTWCAHPTNRTKYMILNPLDWDSMPTPLVTSAVVTTETSRYETPLTPW